MGLFDDLDSQTPEKRETIMRAPFGYPGGKSRSLEFILPHLPVRGVWVEVFGGSGVITLNRPRSKLEVFNDRFSGVTAFYKCMRDPNLYSKLCDWLDLSLHSREEFLFNRDTWESVQDPVERAGRWFAMVNYSFSQLGRNWGRSTSSNTSLSGKVRNKIKDLPEIHARFRTIQVENSSWENVLRDYDAIDTVFYLDPPYIDAYAGTYVHEMSKEDHLKMIEIIFSLKGFVAVSGFANPIYDNRPWDKRFDWEVYSSMMPQVEETNNHSNMDRTKVQECLWIKEAQFK